MGLGDDVGAAELGRRVADSLRRPSEERKSSPLDDLALASGVSRAALSQIEMCRTNPSLAVLWKIAIGLKVPFQVLLGNTDTGTRLLRVGERDSASHGRWSNREPPFVAVRCGHAHRSL